MRIWIDAERRPRMRHSSACRSVLVAVSRSALPSMELTAAKNGIDRELTARKMELTAAKNGIDREGVVSGECFTANARSSLSNSDNEGSFKNRLKRIYIWIWKYK